VLIVRIIGITYTL